jgi:3',5'-cyclic AMP phosphodiesterase CpdA
VTLTTHAPAVNDVRRAVRTVSDLLTLPRLALLALALLLYASAAQAADKPVQTVAKSPSKVVKKQIKTLRFCIYGDTRDGHDVHRKIIALMMKQEPEFVLQTGDLVHNGGNLSQWKIYDDITGAARQKIPFYIVRGNHDFGAKNFEERMTAPTTSGTKFWYSFDRANCHFIGLAVDEETPYTPDSAQYKWLVKDLESTGQTRPTHIFVFFHVAPFSIGAHGSDLDVRKNLSPLFAKYGVRAVFNGHDHNYYHTTREGVTYIVTGGGGAPLYPVDPGKGAIAGDKYESVNNCLVCEVTGDLAAFTTFRADGTTLERFSLHAK